jgi:hypothetical protein
VLAQSSGETEPLTTEEQFLATVPQSVSASVGVEEMDVDERVEQVPAVLIDLLDRQIFAER